MDAIYARAVAAKEAAKVKEKGEEEESRKSGVSTPNSAEAVATPEAVTVAVEVVATNESVTVLADEKSTTSNA